MWILKAFVSGCLKPPVSCRKCRALPKAGEAPEHPGLFVRDTVLPRLRLTMAEAADALAVARPHFYGLMKGRIDMSPAMCLRLAALTGTPAEMLASMQALYSLSVAKHCRTTKAKIKNITRARKAVR